MEAAQSLPTTVVVRRTPREGREAEFEAAMRGFIAEALGFPGSGDFHVVRPSAHAGREYTVVHRFENEVARQAFVESPMYTAWMRRLRELTTESPIMQDFTGVAGWFTLPERESTGRESSGPPTKVKMAIVSFIGVYPLTSTIPGWCSAWLPSWNPLAVNVVATGTIVALLTWAVMPLLTRLFSAWLFTRPLVNQELPA